MGFEGSWQGLHNPFVSSLTVGATLLETEHPAGMESGTKLVSESGSRRKWEAGVATPTALAGSRGTRPSGPSSSSPPPTGYKRTGGGSARSQDRKRIIS